MQIKKLYFSIFKSLLFFPALISLIFIIFSGSISNYLNLNAQIPVVILAFTIFISFFSPVNSGILQGMQRFGPMAVYMFCASFLTLGCAVGMVQLLGLQLNGAMLGIFLSALLTFFVSCYFIRDILTYRTPEPDADKNINIHLAGMLRYSIPVTANIMAFVLLTNADLILVKHFFDPADAGVYAACAVLGRTVYSLPGVFAITIFPMVSESHTLNQSTLGLLKKTLLYAFIMALIGTLLLAGFPGLLLTIFFGEKFVPGAPILRLFAIAMLPLALSSIIAMYNLGRREYKYLYIMTAGCLSELILIYFFHSSLNSVLYILIGTGYTLLAGLGITLALQNSTTTRSQGDPIVNKCIAPVSTEAE